MDGCVDEIARLIERKRLTEEEKIEDTAKKWIFDLCLVISYALTKKVSSSIGHENLSETFKEILERKSINSIHMIDMSIKLDFFRTFPYTEIASLDQKLTKNILPHTLLKVMVIDYLYMFPTTYKDKQRICNLLGIPMRNQRAIDIKSTQKKRK